MVDWALTHVRVIDGGTEDAAAARTRLQTQMPPAALRRMTHLGLLITEALADVPVNASTTVVYASRYAETRALENYLASFPEASPLLFQTSIHPSAVQQALIARAQPVELLVPLTGGDGLAAEALRTAALAETARVVLVGGEERGTWLLDRGMASDAAFAFAVAFERSAAHASGHFREEPGDATAEARPASLHALAEALRERRRLEIAATPGRRLVLSWT